MPQLSTLDGAVINFNDAGNGRPMLFLHGWLMSNLVWTHQQAITDRFRLIAPDLRGHGESGGADFSYESCSADLVTLLDYLDIEKVIIVGWSMGAQIALHSWPQLRSRLAGLVLVGGTPVFCRNESFDHGVPLVEARGMAVRLKRNFNLTAGEFYRGMFTPDECRANDIKAMAKSIIGRLPQPSVAMAALAELTGSDLRRVLPDITVPVLLVHGGADHICLPGASLYMQENLPDSRLEIFPDAGHAPFLTNPSAFHALLTEFAGDIYGRD